MSFLSELWSKLDPKRTKQDESNSQSLLKEVYPGYRSIHIQELEPSESKQYQEKASGKEVWKGKDPIYTYEENAPMTFKGFNGFWDAVYHAYKGHGQLKIKPDDVWITIMLWFTEYINKNAEELRNAFVSHEGEKTLTVFTNQDEKDWKPFFDGIILQITKNTNEGITDKLSCNFSSTGKFQKLFSTAIIMNSFKKYFKYKRLGGSCGIQKVHMGGNLQDWIKLKKKLQNLAEFDVNGKLKKYIAGLQPVLAQFIQTYKGFAHLQFWNNLFEKRGNPNDKTYEPTISINGWLIKFFTIEDSVDKMQKIQEFAVDIKYINLTTKEQKFFILKGGCKGVSTELAANDVIVYRPHFSFVVVLDSEKMKKVGASKKNVSQEHAKVNKTTNARTNTVEKVEYKAKQQVKIVPSIVKKVENKKVEMKKVEEKLPMKKIQLKLPIKKIQDVSKGAKINSHITSAVHPKIQKK